VCVEPVKDEMFTIPEQTDDPESAKQTYEDVEDR